MIAFIFFGCSLLFLLHVSRAKAIEALSLYWVFIVFQCLYNVAPWAASFVDTSALSLLSDHAVIETQLTLSAISNFCFGAVFLTFYKRTPLAAPSSRASLRSGRNIFILAFPVFLLTFALCAKYGWNQFATGVESADDQGGMFTVTAYAKHFFIAIYIYYLYRFRLNRWAWILFLQNAIVMFIDGARTTFFPIAFLTFFIYASQQVRATKKVYILAALAIFSTIAARAIIFTGNSTALQKLVAPVVVEGTMGAYPSLQTIYAVQHHANDGYTYGASYIVDPLLLLLPKGGLRQSQFLKSWEQKINAGIPDEFAPMGGFYYVAEAVAAFSYLGPPLITTLFAALMVWMESVKNRHRLVYFVWAGNIGVLFVKTNFANAFKIFATQLLIVLLFAGIRRYRLFMAASVPALTQAQL
jgi:hypothetical protein